MIERLFIAEKPSLGRAIADGLGGGRKQEGFIQCGKDVVTWGFGHLLEQCDPDEYNPEFKHWRREHLPIIPDVWRLKPRKEASKQLGVVRTLLKDAASAVNAGDPDREGQLLIDEVLEYCKYRGPVQRIWLASLDTASVAKALSSLTDNRQHAPLRDAALARSRADWLVGLNATRAMTILGHESGWGGTLSLGRVQTPTLSLVVTRDREITVFKPIDYFVLQSDFTPARATGAFRGTFVPLPDSPGLDSEGHLVDAGIAQSIADAVSGKQGTAVEVTREKKKKAAPLPYCLSSLQKAASARYGMSAQQVLDTAQSLYEKKLTTYPRSDCSYLPEEQFADAGRVLTALSGVPGLEHVAGKADAKLHGPVWNTGKITAHHAIIPTGERPCSLSEAERNLYLMIAIAYCIQFYPPMQFEAQKIVVEIEGTRWETRGRRILDPGWTQAVSDDEAGDPPLPDVQKGDRVVCAEVSVLKKKTTPPPRFTEGTLIEAMANIHRFVNDSKAKATLKENEGIGTEATRAGIIETLKARGFIKGEGKSLVSTPIGRSLISMTPQALSDPVTTARWESLLSGIAEGKMKLDAFMEAQEKALSALLAPVLSATPKLVPGAHPCPVCGKALLRHQRKDKRGFFWACSTGSNCTQPLLSDDNGKPGKPYERAVASEYPCPVCGQPLFGRTSDKGPYWGCFNKEGHSDGKPVFLPDDNGKPGTPKEKVPQEVSEFICPKCKKPLLHKTGVSKSGKPYEIFSCSGYPKCKESFWGKDGEPDFESGKMKIQGTKK